MRRGWGAGLIAAAMALAMAAPAQGSAGQLSMLMDDNLLLYRGHDVREHTLSELSSLGVDAVRVTVSWRYLAPAANSRRRPRSLDRPSSPAEYPAAAFDPYDDLLRSAERYGIGVLFNVTGPAPLWATGRVRGRPVNNVYKPSPAQFGHFVSMLARRYNGRYRDENSGHATLPRVSTWSIWNEPNQAGWLQPQWERVGGRWMPSAPHLYRRLARAAIVALHTTGHPRDTILLGETAPLGAGRPGRKSHLRPGLFLRELFCLDYRLAPLHRAAARRRGCDFGRRGPLDVTGYAHHPYSVTSPPAAGDPNADDIPLANGDRLERLLDVAAADVRIPRRLPVWYTEYGYQTNPPDPYRGVGLGQQADWLALAELMTWANPRIAAQTQFLLRDDAPRTRYSASDRRYWSTYQTGLQFADGSHKPAYESYRLPLVAPDHLEPGQPLPLWGLVRPGRNGVTQSVQLEFAADGSDRFQPVGDPIQVTDPRGYFQVDVRAAQNGLWRYTWSPPRNPPRNAVEMLLPPPQPTFSSPAVRVVVG